MSLDRETTPWGGMSGAVIVTRDGEILGVVRGHAPAAGVGSLTFTPLAAIDVLPAEKAAEFWGLVGVADPHALPVLPTPEMAGPARSWWARSRPARRGSCTAARWIGWRVGSTRRPWRWCAR